MGEWRNWNLKYSLVGPVYLEDYIDIFEGLENNSTDGSVLCWEKGRNKTNLGPGSVEGWFLNARKNNDPVMSEYACVLDEINLSIINFRRK